MESPADGERPEGVAVQELVPGIAAARIPWYIVPQQENSTREPAGKRDLHHHDLYRCAARGWTPLFATQTGKFVKPGSTSAQPPLRPD